MDSDEGRAPSPQPLPSRERRTRQHQVGFLLVSDREPICPGPAATDFWPHRLRVAFAEKEESRGASLPGNIAQ
jgi:hypothetical protein